MAKNMGDDMETGVLQRIYRDTCPYFNPGFLVKVRCTSSP